MKKIILFTLIILGLFMLFSDIKNSFHLPFGSKDDVAMVSKNIQLIDLEVNGATTNIIPEDRNDLAAELEGKGRLLVKQKGDKIQVTVKRNWFEGFPFFKKSKLTLYIPEDFDQNFNIEIGSGNLKFNGKSEDKPMNLDVFSLEVGSGNVDLANIKTNNFIHDGSSGNLTINSLTTEEGSFDISSGNVELKHFIGKLDAELSSGSFKVQMDKLTASVDIDVSSGSVKLNLPQDADFTLNGDVSSGTITSDFPINEQNGNRIKGSNGSGKFKINLDVSSGKIDIY
jgi:lia operon protein LiaG